MHRNAVVVSEAAAARGLAIEVREFPEGTRTAQDAADAIGVELGQIVKSLVFAVGARAGDPEGRIVVALVAGDNQLDERKLAAAAGCAKAWRVDADAVRAATGFPVGGVAPFGHPSPLPTFVDVTFDRFGEVWAAAGTPHHVFALAPEALIGVTGAVRADLAKVAAAPGGPGPAAGARG